MRCIASWRHFPPWPLVWAVLLLAACGSPPGREVTTPQNPPAGLGTCPAEGVCFFAVGDTGTGDANQAAVAAGIAAKCEKDGCAFGVLLGDLIYEMGASSHTDPQFQTKFAQPYASVSGPFHAVLGNHDYNGTGTWQNWDQAANYIGYAASQSKFSLPGGTVAYGLEAAPVLLVGLDTQQILYDHAGAVASQGALAAAAVAGSSQPWRIAFGHHPYLSNGPHGNAGSYDSAAALPGNGQRVQAFIEANVCGQFDGYFSGHDHSRQVFAAPPACPGTLLVVSGAGAKQTGLPNSNTPAPLFQRGSLGFAYVRATPTRLEIEMLADDGSLEFSMTLP